MNTPALPPQKIDMDTESELSTGSASQLVDLKLYIARSTPNSVRAEHNLHAALKTIQIEDVTFNIEVIDVFTNGKRAILDSVIVTPTLIVEKGNKRQTIVGDLSETMQLHAVLKG